MITKIGLLSDRGEFPDMDEGMTAGLGGEPEPGTLDIKKALLYGGLIVVGIIVLRRIL